MKTITVNIDEGVFRKARQHAEEHSTTPEALMRSTWPSSRTGPVAG